MRVGVIGAGAIGGAIAALLARGGHEVEVAARGDQLAEIRAHGLRLTGGWGDFVVPVAADVTLSRTPELAFIATKAQDAPAAIRANDNLLTGIPVVVVQNGLDAISATAPMLPHSDVVGALAVYASSFVEPGHIAITTTGPTYLGGGPVLSAMYAAEVLNQVMPTKVETNFVGAQWTKLLVNQVNALPAITGMSVQDVIANPRLRRIMTLSMRENVRVGIATGVRFAAIQGLNNGLVRAFSRAPVGVADQLPKLMARRMGATPNPGSTLQSIRRGGVTEIDYLNGAVVEAAAAAGTSAPINAAIVALVHEVELTREFLSPDEVVARVPR
jgi:2-dehydropantoate 2-reductase